MAYVRKTRDVYHVQVNYGWGFETVTYEDTWKDAKAMARDYRDNEPYPVRVVKRREKINEN